MCVHLMPGGEVRATAHMGGQGIFGQFFPSFPLLYVFPGLSASHQAYKTNTGIHWAILSTQSDYF